MRIDVVIPNYNGSELIKKNLPKVIYETEKYNSLIIIPDDGSKEEDFNSLSSFVENLKNKRIKLVRYEKNLGFSSNLNRGVSLSSADFVVLLNSDVIPEKDFLENALKDILNDESLFGVGFMDKSVEAGQTVLRGRGLASWSRGFLIHRRGEVDHEDTFWISGGSSIVRRELFNKLSGFDPLYNPFYWEDIDLSYRARKSGYKVKFQPKSVVVHKHSEGAIKKNFTNFKVKKIAYRNQLIFIWKNITDLSLIMSHLMWLPLSILSAVLRYDLAFILGFLLAVLKLPDIIMRRLSQAKLYKLRDSEIIKQ